MFGHQDDQTEPQDNQDNVVADENQTAPTDNNEQAEAVTADTQPADTASNDTPTDEPALNGVDELVIEPGSEHSDDSPAPEAAQPEPQVTDDSSQHPDNPQNDDKPIRDIISPAGGSPNQLSYQHQGAFSVDENPKPDDDGANQELVDIRNHALGDLSPIIDKLDLPPEDKFRIIMMIIQSSDNQDLVKQAYDAAHAIEDEKTRAQALFDIVNEINYFTTPHETQPDE